MLGYLQQVLSAPEPMKYTKKLCDVHTRKIVIQLLIIFGKISLVF